MLTKARDLARLPHAVGAELATLLERLWVDLDQLTDAERLEVVKATARLEAWTAALRAAAINAVFDSAAAEIAADAAELAQAHARLTAGSGPAAETPAAVPAAEAPVGRTVAGYSHCFDDQRLLHRRVGTEVSLVLGVSPWVADREVDLARDLAAHPPLGRALAEGRVDRTQALVIGRGLRDLTSPDPAREQVLRGRLLARLLGPDDSPDGDDYDPDEPAHDADDHGRPVGLVRELTRPGTSAWMLVPGKLKLILAREIARLDPTAPAHAAEQARTERRLTFDPQPSFMTELHLRTTTQAAAAIWANLDHTARAARHRGDPRTLDQLRADIATGWLTEGAYGTLVTRPQNPTMGADLAPPERAEPAICLPRPRGPLVHLTVAATTILGLDHEPGTLHGPTGPIPIPHTIAQELAHTPGARWRRLLYDPDTGIATDLSPSYHPPDPIADYVRARDGHTTRHPTSCATHLELDHIHPYNHAHPDHGGPTTPANLSSNGQRDHQLKTDGILRVSGDANADLTITTPSGRSYPSPPALHADPGPPPY
jgi:hypothetical protein